MAAQVTNYQCPACTGPLQFNPASGQLSCEYCGSTYPVAEIEALYADKNAKAEENMAKAEAKKAEGGEQWDTSGLSDDWGAEGEGMKAYNCPSCGAELICDATTAATSCPYCGNPSIVPGQFSGTLKPDFVLPFKLDKKQAIAALQKHYEGKPLLPNAFKDQNHLQEIKGVYVPFWLFDGEAEGSMVMEGLRLHTYESGDEEIEETEHFEILREGSISFANIPVDASSKMPDDYMESLEPYNYGDLTPFSNAYLPGYLADKYDIAAEDSAKRADQRAEQTAEDSLRGSVSGYDVVNTIGKNMVLHRGQVKYALLPVWLLTTKWKDQTYLFAMNGQTGKFVGNLPVDNGKKWRRFAAVFGIAAAVTAIAVLFPGGLMDLLGM